MRCGSCSAPLRPGSHAAVCAAILPQRQPAGRPAAFDGKHRYAGGTRQLEGQGNGLLSAAAHGLSRWVNAPFVIKDYHEHTLGERSDSRSVAYIRCLFQDGSSRWGVGIDSDVARASLQALLNAVSRS